MTEGLEFSLSEGSSAPEFDARWKNLTLQANADLKRGDLVAAGAAYDLAFHEARMIFAEAWNGHARVQPHAPPMLIVSATNTANHRRIRGDKRAAKEQLVSAVRIFTEALESSRAPESLKRGCAEHLPRLLADVSAHHNDALAIVEEARSAALAYLKKSAN
ncbi:MAG: hypothetical protein AAFZ74_10400 [Pseudomonadota bacterium]